METIELKDGVFLAPFRGRPAGIRRLWVSVMQCDPAARVVAIVGRGDPQFDEVMDALSETTWRFVVLDGDPTGIEKVNAGFARYPNERFYGVLANDMELLVPGTLKAVASAVPRAGVAWADDGNHGQNLASTPVVCGDLVRAQGWFMYPEANHNGPDVYLMEIAHLFGGLRFVPGYGFKHYHPCCDMSVKRDATHELVARGRELDEEAHSLWRSRDCVATIRRVQEALQWKRQK